MAGAKERLRLATVGAQDQANHQQAQKLDLIAKPALSASIEPLATIESWAAALVVSVPTIERLRRAGKIPSPDVMIGRLPRWKPSTIRAWIESGGRS
jgi:predicted DNA-binding transcriptional regulator AlpA